MSARYVLRAMLGSVAMCLYFSAIAWGQAPFIRGDLNCDGVVDDLDVNLLNAVIFTGAAIPCDDAADVDDNGEILLGDLTALASYIATGGPPPAAPFPNCGLDPTADDLTCAAACCGASADHFKVWQLQPQAIDTPISVRDQFMSGDLQLTGLEYLANPARKDTFGITQSADHLTWYRAQGRDTLLSVEFITQFGIDTVVIDAVTHLLLPTQKLPHSPPDVELDHYKAYHIQNPRRFARKTETEDQFNAVPEVIDSLAAFYFLTPASVNEDPIHDSIIHYVAYDIFPKLPLIDTRNTVDLFGEHIVDVVQSELLMVPAHKLTVTIPSAETSRNHFKSWRIDPIPYANAVDVTDAFMSDVLTLDALVILSNPARKDTSGIKRPDDHLNWYHASGRDTLLQIEYENQFGIDTVVIDSVRHLLVPCQKLPHDPPDALLGHYKSYRIRNGQVYRRPGGVPVELEDQFDLESELVDSLLPVLFLTPAEKNGEPIPAADTHYVAYEIFPKRDVNLGRTTIDQFGSWNITARRSVFLLVPSHVIAHYPPPTADTVRNHFKSWRLDPVPLDTTVRVEDQFMSGMLRLDSIKLLSNPARKDGFSIVRPDDHLLWYGARGRDTCLRVIFENQFGPDTLVIGRVTHLLLPAQKEPHDAPDSMLGHFKAYRVWNPTIFERPTQLEDQFDLEPELIERLVPRYFCTPAAKGSEPVYDSSTHYVAYELFPKRDTVITRMVTDQWGNNMVTVRRSQLLMVPTQMYAVEPICPIIKPGDINCDNAITSGDIIALVNYTFKGGPEPCPCVAAGDINCDGAITSADIIGLVNYVFKSGTPPCDPCDIIPALWVCPC